MLKFIEKKLKKEKIKTIELHVSESNKKGISFYEQNGFKKIIENKGKYKRFRMIKKL